MANRNTTSRVKAHELLNSLNKEIRQEKSPVVFYSFEK
jgi:hypothetical protein